MKKMIFSLLAIAAMTSCTTTSEDEIDPNAPVEIKLSAGIEATSSNLSRAITGPIDGATFPASQTDIFRITAFTGEAIPTTWASPKFAEEKVNSAAKDGENIPLQFATAQYYNPGEKVYFYAYSSAGINTTDGYSDGTASSSPKVNYTITGQEDIMWAKNETGCGKATDGSVKQPTLSFSHKLMQLQFRAEIANSFPNDMEITEIKILGCKTEVTLDISLGTLSFGTGNTKDLEAFSGKQTIGAAANTNTFGNKIMIEPKSSLDIQVLVRKTGETTTTTYTANGVVVTNATTGGSYIIKLTFSPTGMDLTSDITPWVPTENGEASMK